MLRWLEAIVMTECSSIFESGNKCPLFQRLSLIMSDVTGDGGRDCIQNVSSFHSGMAGCLWGCPCIFVSCCCYWYAEGFLCHLDWVFHMEQEFMCSYCLIPSIVARCYSICYIHLMYVCMYVCMCTLLDIVLLFEEEKHVLLRVTVKRYTLCFF
jgi:hypothetical protein